MKARSYGFGRYVLGSCVAALLAACGESQPPIGMPGAMPQRLMMQAPSNRNVHLDATTWFLYVGVQGFEVYPLGARRPVREYGGSLTPKTLALDPWNDIYTAGDYPSGGAIAAYTPGGRSVLLEISGYPSGALALDAQGNLYAASIGGVVAEYAPRSTKQIRTIKTGGEALAVDSKGDLYIAEGTGSYSEVGVFPPDAKKPARVITTGIDGPVALLIDKSNDLFVANCPDCSPARPHGGWVTEYTYGSGTPLRTITEGIDIPVAMALDARGRLFVANYGYFRRGSVTVYSSGTTPVRTITTGIRNPDALAVGPEGNLYVANCAFSKDSDSITAYAPSGRLVLRITDGVGACPLSIAIGKGS